MREVEILAERLKDGDKRALSKALTLAESVNPDHMTQLSELFRKLKNIKHKSLKLAISGSPGVGKSTFIEAMGLYLCNHGYSVAVLAVDPSSPKSGGSILGDKTRMNELAAMNSAFIRPTPSDGNLGGVARSTENSIKLCEVVGFDFILVETLGVGQGEFSARKMTDMFVLILSPLGGDDLQGIKKGIVELADMILVNKSDGDHEHLAANTLLHYESALKVSRKKLKGWDVPVRRISALNSTGIEEVYSDIKRFKSQNIRKNGCIFESEFQAKESIMKDASGLILNHINSSPILSKHVTDLSKEVLEGKTSVKFAAKQMLSYYSEDADKNK